MSESAWLVCDAAQVVLCLGKPIRHPDRSVHYFHGGSTNSENVELTKALWKFLADHAEREIRIVSSYSPEFETVAAYRMVGGDSADDIDYPQYLAGWPG